MSLADFLQLLVEQLEAAGIPFMVSGSVASGHHGEPRATYDIDVVIEADQDQIDRLVSSLTDRCYVSAAAARDAIAHKSMFNVIDLQTGIKADLILRKDRPFSIAEFQRRRSAEIFGVRAFIVSPEDCVLSKLEWSRLGESERQYRDALRIACVAGVGLDVPYMKNWATELNVAGLLDRLLRESGLEAPS